MYLDIGQPRRDGKYPVTFLSGYVGSKSRPIRKVLTLSELVEACEKHGTPEQLAQYRAIKARVDAVRERIAEANYLESMGV